MPELSEAAKEKSTRYYETNEVAPVIKGSHTEKSSESSQGYVAYQREVEAAKLLDTGHQPDNPGKILKLPLNRRKIPSD